MKITRENYVKVVGPFARKGFASLPDPTGTVRDTFSELHTDLEHDSAGFKDFSRIDADSEVKALEALYYQKLTKYLNKETISTRSRTVVGKTVAQSNRVKTATRKTDMYIDRELQFKLKLAKAKLLLLN